MKEASSLETALQQLDAVAPDIPLLALGQTIFWDETMKGAVAQALTRSGSSRRYLAGVHDTDYFAKASGEKPQPGKFKACLTTTPPPIAFGAPLANSALCSEARP